ncbi:MAG: adenylate/guanylate cyclase domain-containing protein [Saprospiraceae bacterium]|nr:adenylate/guanylate cyclase domain-containing protein [Saprospiraceae bacterium]
MNTDHKLAAIVFADITGYTAMMEAHEQRAFRTLQRFVSAVKASVAQFDGHIIQFWGDGCLAIFESAVDAIDCSVHLQRSFLADAQVPVRIGIDSGEILLTDSNAYGNAINVSARLEAIGVPGSVLLTQKVKEELKNKPRYKLDPLGRLALKNVKEPVTVYAVDDGILPVPCSKHLERAGVQRRKRKWRISAIWALLASAMQVVIDIT